MGGRDGLAVRGPPPAHTSRACRLGGSSTARAAQPQGKREGSRLRDRGWIPALGGRNDGKGGGWAAPPLGVDSRVGAYQRPTCSIFDRLGDWNDGEKRKRDVWDWMTGRRGNAMYGMKGVRILGRAIRESPLRARGWVPASAGMTEGDEGWDRVYTNRRNRTVECRIDNGI